MVLKVFIGETGSQGTTGSQGIHRFSLGTHWNYKVYTGSQGTDWFSRNSQVLIRRLKVLFRRLKVLKELIGFQGTTGETGAQGITGFTRNSRISRNYWRHRFSRHHWNPRFTLVSQGEAIHGSSRESDSRYLKALPLKMDFKVPAGSHRFSRNYRSSRRSCSRNS